MDTLYSILTGPGLYLTLAVFFIGLTARLVLYFLGLDWRLERVAYKPFMAHGLKGGFHSAFKWLIPFGTHGWRAQPFATVAFFLLHFGAVLLPLFLVGHNVVLQEKFGFSLFSMPQGLADVLSVMSMIGLAAILLRRLSVPEVRILTTAQDYALVIVVFLIFFTGFMAVQQIGNPKAWMLGHIFLAELLLITAPFTKMAHIALYFGSRIQIGMDFAIKRGGQSRKSGACFPW